MRDEVGDFWRNGFVANRELSFQVNGFKNIAAIVFDFEDGSEVDFEALVSKDTKSNSHVNHADFAAAKSER